MSEENKDSVRKPVHPGIIQRRAFNGEQILTQKRLFSQYGYHIDHLIDPGEPFILMSNHVMEQDAMFLLSAVKNFMYFLCSEHLLRNKSRVPKLIRFSDAITMYNGSIATGAVREILRRIKEGNSVCIFPEGGCSYDGRTNPIPDSSGHLVKAAHCALVTFRLHGGYFVHPRWALNLRRGNVRGEVVHVFSAKELESMSVDEINKIIREDLYVDAYAEMAEAPVSFPGEGLAEGIENLFYLCPCCGSWESLRSKGDDFWCNECDLYGTLDSYGKISGAGFSFENVQQWADWTNAEFDRLYETEGLFFENENVTLYEIQEDHSKKRILNNMLITVEEGLHIGEYVFPFSEMESCETIRQGNVFLFTIDGHHYTLESPYLAGLKFIKLYRKNKERLISRRLIKHTFSK